MFLLPTLSKYEINWFHSYIDTLIPGSSAHQLIFTLVRVQSPSARALKWPYKTTFLITANSLHKMSMGYFHKNSKKKTVGICRNWVSPTDGQTWSLHWASSLFYFVQKSNNQTNMNNYNKYSLQTNKSNLTTKGKRTWSDDLNTKTSFS